mgnify:CR=1 FL=1
MTDRLPLLKFYLIFISLLIVSSCGSDMVENIIETYQSGNKKVYVRYHPEVNVLEKHFYNAAGEMIHLERDSLSYGFDFKNFLQGNWIMESMTVDGDLVFEKDSIYNPETPPNVYLFSGKKLLVNGPQYTADYSIDYLDSSQVELEGKWTYGIEGEDTYRSDRIYDIDYIQVLSYYNFLWTDFLEDVEKEEEVIFRRVEITISKSSVDTLITPLEN